MTSSSSAAKPNRSRLSKWLKRGLIGGLVLANLAVFFVYWRLTSLEEVVERTALTIPEVVSELTPTIPERRNIDPLTFLVIGSDTREGLSDLSNFGDFGGERADVIMLVQLFPEQDRAQILSLPRDLWVPIPDHGENRINAALSFGGPSLMVKTVREATNLPIHHYVEVNFVGFKAIVDRLGGVTIDFPYPARDRKSGLSVEAGSQKLDGSQALAYARSRSYQENRNGSWRSIDANDIGRTRRQQALILAILSEMARPSSIVEAGSLVETFAAHLGMDSALAESSLVELAFRMRGIRPSSIETATLPTVGTTIRGASVLLRDEPAATEMLTAFRTGDPLGPVLEGPFAITVLNGNGVAGSASRWSDHLAEQGHTIVRVSDAQDTDFPRTSVLVRPGQGAVGEAIVEALGFGVVDFGSLEDGVDAMVVLGTDATEVASGSDGTSG